MSSKLLKTIGLISLIMATNALAQRPQNLQPVPEPPPMPDQLESGEAIPLGEPQVTIIQRQDAVIHEYRLNGRLFSVRITPRNAPPYYLIDMDGDGRMERRMGDIDQSRIIVPQWVLFRW